jgi:hypothetical protein
MTTKIQKRYKENEFFLLSKKRPHQEMTGPFRKHIKRREYYLFTWNFLSPLTKKFTI